MGGHRSRHTLVLTALSAVVLVASAGVLAVRTARKPERMTLSLATASPSPTPTPTPEPTASPTPSPGPASPTPVGAARTPVPRTPKPPTERPAPAAQDPNPGAITYIGVDAQGRPARWDPCRPIRYKVNVSRAPDGAREMVQEAVRRAKAATGLSFTYEGETADEPPTHDINSYELLIGWFAGNYYGSGDSSQMQVRSGPTAGGERIEAGVIMMNTGRSHSMAFTGGTRSTWGWGMRMLHRLGNVAGVRMIEAKHGILSRDTSAQVPEDYAANDRTALETVGASRGCLS